MIRRENQLTDMNRNQSTTQHCQSTNPIHKIVFTFDALIYQTLFVCLTISQRLKYSDSKSSTINDTITSTRLFALLISLFTLGAPRHDYNVK